MTIPAPDTGVPPYVLITGAEQVLAERAMDSTLEAVRGAMPDLEVIRLRAEGYEPGSIGVHASPSLFGGAKALVVYDLDEGTDELIEDVLALLETPAEDVTLIVLHKGGNRGKRALDALKKAGARVIECPAMKSDRDKAQFVTNEFRTARRKIDTQAVTMLVQAVGRDLRELASACAQLIADTSGVVDTEAVDKYYGGKVETTGFKVAEAAIAGNTAEALRLLRHAIAGGVNPVPIVAVLGSQLRQVGKVASAGRGPSGAVAKQLGLPPWQVDQARKASQGWDGDRLGRAIQAVAEADVEVKGGLRSATGANKDPVYAVERAVLSICRERQAV